MKFPKNKLSVSSITMIQLQYSTKTTGKLKL